MIARSGNATVQNGTTLPTRQGMLGFALSLMLMLGLPTAPGAAAAEDAGLVTLPSRHSAADTVKRFEDAVRAGGWTVFTTIDHAAAARNANLALPPRTVIFFGNPSTGTPPMRAKPTLALDLPMRVLVWENAAGKAHLTRSTGRDTAARIFARHGIDMPDEASQKLEAFLATAAKKATE